jgi:hypothetical protein
VIGRCPLHAKGTGGDAAKNIAAADHNGQLHIQFDDGADLFRHIGEHIGTDAEALITHQGFTAQFEQDPFDIWPPPLFPPIWNRANRLMVIFSPVWQSLR